MTNISNTNQITDDRQYTKTRRLLGSSGFDCYTGINYVYENIK